MEKVRQVIRLSIINESDGAAMRGYVGERVYPAEIATVGDPQYPCLNFHIAAAPHVILSDVWSGTMRVWIWTKNGYSEAHKILDALVSLWHNQRLSSAALGRSVVLRQTGGASETFDEGERAYGLVTGWDIKAIA